MGRPKRGKQRREQHSKRMMLPEERGIMPFVALPYAIPHLESFYGVQAVAETVSTVGESQTDVKWAVIYHIDRDAALIRGSIAAKIVVALPQPLTVLRGSLELPTQLATVPVAVQPWINFPDRRGELTSWFLVPPGLRPLIGAVAKRLGLDWPKMLPADLPTPQSGTDECGYTSSTPVLDWIQKHPTGLFRYAGGLHLLARHIVAVRRRWPKPYRIIVVTASNREAKKVSKEIERLRVEYSPLAAGSILVAGVHRLHRFLAVDSSGELTYSRNRVILLVADAAMVAAETSADALGRLPHVRLYGFLAASNLPEPFVASRLAAFFGVEPVLVNEDAPDGRTGLDLKFMKWGYCSRLSKMCRPTKKLKEQGVWFCNERNRYIRFLAYDAAGPALIKCFRQFRLMLNRRPMILVLVESAAHLHELDDLMGDTWSAVELDESGNPVWRTAKTGRRKVIATFAAAEHAPAADIVFRCDGGPGLPHALRRVIRHCSKILLIDIADSYPPVLRRFCRSRKEVYGAEGWIPARDPAVQYVEALIDAIQRQS